MTKQHIEPTSTREEGAPDASQCEPTTISGWAMLERDTHCDMPVALAASQPSTVGEQHIHPDPEGGISGGETFRAVSHSEIIHNSASSNRPEDRRSTQNGNPNPGPERTRQSGLNRLSRPIASHNIMSEGSSGKLQQKDFGSEVDELLPQTTVLAQVGPTLYRTELYSLNSLCSRPGTSKRH